MLRKLGIVLAVIALGMTSIQTDAFARGGGGGGHGGGGGGGHFGGGGGHFGGGGFGGGHFGGGGFGGRGFGGGGFANRGFGGGQFANRGGFVNHGFHNRFAGRRFVRPFAFDGGDWGYYCNDWPYDNYYGYYGYSCY